MVFQIPMNVHIPWRGLCDRAGDVNFKIFLSDGPRNTKTRPKHVVQGQVTVFGGRGLPRLQRVSTLSHWYSQILQVHR